MSEIHLIENTTEEDGESIEENFKTTKTQIYTLAGTYLGCSIVGPLILALFLDPLST